MILGQVDFPDDLMRSLEGGSCVVFAGAGVSCGPPAKLPLFKGLVSLLAGEDPPDNEALDRFVGRLGDRDRFVARTVEIVRGASDHNPLHEILVRMFPSVDQLRIVTTNYDQLFEAAGRKVFGCEPQAFHAPALPLGRSFHGIVHVHGSVLHPEGIVLTDADFGRAYLSDGWARRFLVELFQDRDVLFVGYSHDDTIMDYLARALPPSQRRRYALVPGGDDEGPWQRRNITAIPFGSGRNAAAYALQQDSLWELAGVVQRTAIDWARTTARMAAAEPPQDKAVQSQAVHALSRPLSCRLFVEHRPAPTWVRWMTDQGVLNGLIEGSKDDECVQILSRWLSHVILSEHPLVMVSLLRRSVRISPRFWHDLVHGMLQLPDQTDTAVAHQLLGILSSTIPSDADGFEVRLLAESAAKHRAVEVLVVIFVQAVRCLPEFPKWRLQEDRPERALEVRWRWDHRHLADVIKDLQPHLDTCALRLFPIVCETLHQCFAIRSNWQLLDDAFDTDSFGRAAIEPHGQDRFQDACDPVIDFARTISEWMALHVPEQLRSWMSTALKSRVPLIRRLAVHNLTILPGQSPDDALQAIIAGPIHDRWCRHEAFMVIKAYYQVASTEVRRALLAEIRKKTSLDPQAPTEDVAHDYFQLAHDYFQWVGFIATVDPLCEEASRERDAVQSTYPNVGLREHPDLTHWSTSGKDQEQSPVSVPDFLHLDPAGLIADEIGRRAGFARLSAYYDNITKAAEVDPVWADRLVIGLLAEEVLPERLSEALLSALPARLSDPVAFPAAVTLLEHERLQNGNSGTICSILYRLVEKDPPVHVVRALPRLDSLAWKLWKIVQAEQSERSEPEDWLQEAINTSAGILAEYVVTSLSVQVRAEPGASPPPMPAALRRLMLDMLDTPSMNGGFCRSVYASQVGFLYGLDSDLTTQHLLPLFESLSPSIRAQAWQGFLTWGNLYPALANAMRSAFAAALAGDHGAFGRSTDSFAEHLMLAGAMIGDACALAWLLDAKVQANATLRHALARHTIVLLRDAPPEILERHWLGWILPYWKARVSAHQPALDAQEVAILLDGCDDLEPVIHDVALLVEPLSSVNLEFCHIAHALHEKGIDERHPIAVAKVVRYLLRCDGPHWNLYGADKVVSTVAPRLEDRDQRRDLVDAALRKNVLTSEDALRLLADP